MISSGEAGDIIHKLVTEQVPVFACFTAADGSRCTLAGFVQSLSEDGLTVVATDNPSRPSLMQLPVDGTCTFTFGDKREIPEGMERERLAATYGEAVLFVAFTSGSRLIIFFNP